MQCCDISISIAFRSNKCIKHI